MGWCVYFQNAGDERGWCDDRVPDAHTAWAHGAIRDGRDELLPTVMISTTLVVWWTTSAADFRFRHTQNRRGKSARHGDVVATD